MTVLLAMCMWVPSEARNSPQPILAALEPAQADRCHHRQDNCNAVSELHVTYLFRLLLLLLLQPQWGMQCITVFCCSMGKSNLQATQAPVAKPQSNAAGTARYATKTAPKAIAPISPVHRCCGACVGLPHVLLLMSLLFLAAALPSCCCLCCHRQP
jgi:hypothetical protein